MSTRFPTANYKQVSKVAEKLGFCFYKQAKGSHEIWWREKDSKYTTIPNHGKKDIKRRTLKAIMNNFGISPEEFSKIKSGR